MDRFDRYSNAPYYLTAYGLAVKHGYRGTESEFVDDLMNGAAHAAEAAQGSQAAAAASAATAIEKARDSANHEINARAYAEAAAGSAATAEGAAATAAGEAAQQVLDDTPQMITDWLEEHVSPETGYVIDNSLTIEEAAADAKATGDKITSSHFAVDELGSVFSTQNELYLYHQASKDCPEYEFHLSEDVAKGRWKTNLSPATVGFCTKNHPVDVDDSMVLHIPPAAYSQTNSVSFAIGHMEDGAFVPDNVLAWTTADKGISVNIRSYKRIYSGIDEPKLILQTGGDLSLLKNLRLTQKNPYCELTPFPRVSLANSNYGSFVPEFGSDGTSYKPITSFDGRKCKYYTTRAKAVKIEKDDNGNYYQYTESGVEIPVKNVDWESYLGARQVRFKNTAATLESFRIGTGTDKGTLFVDYPLPAGSTALSIGDRVSYEYIAAKNDPVQSRPWHLWLYARGLPLDAMFYDKAGNLIPWYNGLTSINECLEKDNDVMYPSLIKIPDGTTTYHFSVYGPASIVPSSTTTLGALLVEYLYDICAYGTADRTPIPTVNAGTAMRNASKMINWNYKARCIPTRYHIMTDSDYARANGIPYAQASRFILGTHVSYYTYLSTFRKLHGYGFRWGNGFNANVGLMCAAFVSAAVGLPHYQGVEFFIQKYTSKLEHVTPDMEVRPGDMLVSTHYYRPRSDSIKERNLNTHIALITDVLYDRENGYFIGYKVAEEANIWTRYSIWKLANITAKVSNSQRIYTETHSPSPPEAPRACEAHTWRLRMPFADVPDISDTYRFLADKETDPLRNPDIEFPPVLSEFGDRCIVGDYPVVYTGTSPGYSGPSLGYGSGDTFESRFYVERAYTSIDILLSTDGGQTFSSVAQGIPVGTSTIRCGSEYYSLDLQEYMAVPGIYKIQAYLDGAATPSDNYSLFLLPDYPDSIERDETGKQITITGAELTGGKVICKGFDEVWVRVIPYPATGVDGVDGGVLPWANYMYVPAAEVWDAENNRIDLGRQYDYAVGLTLYRNDFGAVEYRFTPDDNDPTPIDSDEPDPDDGDDDGNPEGPRDT